MTRRFGPTARALLAAITLILTAFMASVAPAAATTGEPLSGDTRATVHSGNAVTCADAGLAGKIVDVKFVVDSTNHFIDIVALPANVTLTGIVVKGGNAYNVYGPNESSGLHSPLNPGGIAEISHWYACGQEVSTSPGKTAGTESPQQNGENASKEDSTAKTADEAQVADASVPAASTPPGGSAGSAAAGTDTGNLANTGFSGLWLLLAGTGLLAIGLGLVFGVRATRRRGDSTSS